jgi:hypothetical protein
LQGATAGKHLPPLEAVGALGKLVDGRSSLIGGGKVSCTAALHAKQRYSMSPGGMVSMQKYMPYGSSGFQQMSSIAGQQSSDERGHALQTSVH